MSRFLDTALRAEQARLRPRSLTKASFPVGFDVGQRPHQVLTVTSNKGGVGKTTIAANLAVYLRALREDLPILVLGLDEQTTLDRMFALDDAPPRETVASALRMGSLASAIRLGQYGIHYVPSSRQIAELKREIVDPLRLQRMLLRSDWKGLVVVDTKSDLEILTRNAIAASDLALVVVKDHASLLEAEDVFAMLEEMGRPPERARIVLSLVDLRIKYREDESRDVLGLLLSEIRRRGYPLLESFISNSPKVESLYTNPEGRAHSILHGAPGSLVHRQMRHLAEEVSKTLDELQRRRAEPICSAMASEPVRDWKSLLLRGRQEEEDEKLPPPGEPASPGTSWIQSTPRPSRLPSHT